MQQEPSETLAGDSAMQKEPNKTLSTESGTQQRSRRTLATESGTQQRPRQTLATESGTQQEPSQTLATESGTQQEPSQTLATESGTQQEPSQTLATESGKADDQEPGQPEESTVQQTFTTIKDSTAQQTLTTVKDSPESGKKRGLARQAKGVITKLSNNTNTPQKSCNKGISKASPNTNTKRGKNKMGTSLRPGPQQMQSHHSKDKKESSETHVIPQASHYDEEAVSKMQRVLDLSARMHGIVHSVDKHV
jgi:hypothetical protein